MSRYIDADWLAQKFNEILDNPKEYDKPIHDMLRELYFAPSADVVEVVRCKDCKYARIEDGEIACQLDDGEVHRPQWQLNDFCSYGKRKDD